jgi:hypothetical protein
LGRLESYEGVNATEILITTRLVYYQEWVKREIDKRLKSEEEQGQLQKQQQGQEQQLATQQRNNS